MTPEQRALHHQRGLEIDFVLVGGFAAMSA